MLAIENMCLDKSVKIVSLGNTSAVLGLEFMELENCFVCEERYLTDGYQWFS